MKKYLKEKLLWYLGGVFYKFLVPNVGTFSFTNEHQKKKKNSVLHE